jgi:hypothetical protein
MRLSVFGAGHYVPPYDADIEDFDPNSGRISAEAEIDYFEVGGGVLLSANLSLDEKTTLVPYGGFAISVLRGSVDTTVNFSDLGIVATSDADLEEDDLAQLVIGGSLLFNEIWSIRVEGRVVGDSSVSAGAGVAF